MRQVREGIYWVGVMDWDRRWFDALVPTPEGTSYNAWLVRGSKANALLDTVDPAFQSTLLRNLIGLERLDYVVAHHAEQDHSGALPAVLERFPEARVLCSPRCAEFLQDLLPVLPERIRTVADGEEISLGDRTLRFLHMPWVHWPETMVTYCPEERVLFTCDMFGAHLATSELEVSPEHFLEPAKRYYAEIMMPFRGQISRHLQRLSTLEIALICPSHGPIYRVPNMIMDVWNQWVNGAPKNEVLVPYVSMHGSTQVLVERLVEALSERGIPATPMNMLTNDLGKLAMALVEPMTVVFASPVVVLGIHPMVQQAIYTAAMLKPKARHVSLLGSYSWGGKPQELMKGLLGTWKVELLQGVLCKGHPGVEALRAVEELAEVIRKKHHGAV